MPAHKVRPHLQEVRLAGVCPLDVLVKVVQQVLTLCAAVKGAVQLTPHVEHCAGQLHVRVPEQHTAQHSTSHQQVGQMNRDVIMRVPMSKLTAVLDSKYKHRTAAVGWFCLPSKCWLGCDTAQVNSKGCVATVECHVGSWAVGELHEAHLNTFSTANTSMQHISNINMTAPLLYVATALAWTYGQLRPSTHNTF